MRFWGKAEPWYVWVLGAFYLRLTGTDIDVYRYLEPLYNDYRKLRQKSPDGRFSLTHVDEIIDEFLTKDYSCDIALPRIKKRWNLESVGALDPRKSALEDDFEEEEEKEDNDLLNDGPDDTSLEKDYHRGRSPERERDQDRRRYSHRYSSSDECTPYKSRKTKSLAVADIVPNARRLLHFLRQLSVFSRMDPKPFNMQVLNKQGSHRSERVWTEGYVTNHILHCRRQEGSVRRRHDFNPQLDSYLT